MTSDEISDWVSSSWSSSDFYHKASKSQLWTETEKPGELVLWALMASTREDTEQIVSETRQVDKDIIFTDLTIFD